MRTRLLAHLIDKIQFVISPNRDHESRQKTITIYGRPYVVQGTEVRKSGEYKLKPIISRDGIILK